MDLIFWRHAEAEEDDGGPGEREGVPDAAVAEYFDLIPQRYFISHTPNQIARHARVATEHRPDRLFTHGIREMRGE